MYTEVMKWVSIAALLLTLAFWGSASTYQSELSLVISAAATIVFIQAVRAKSYPWAGGFLAMALLFNPLVPVFRLSGDMSIAIVALAIAPFSMSLMSLRPQPLLSIPSITDRTPGSQSL
jgi:hypothetical protein